MHYPYREVPEIARSGSAHQYKTGITSPLIGDRIEEFINWYDQRVLHGLWPYNKMSEVSPGTNTSIMEESGRRVSGINLASQDYLSLARHELIVESAVRAAKDFGVHSSGSAILMGNTLYSKALELQIAEALCCENILLFPTGWGAGFGVLRGLVQPSDHVVIDALAHNCLQEGASFATKKIVRTPHLNNDFVRRVLGRIRRSDRDNAIFVVSEGLFSMDSDTPNLRDLQDICKNHNATLVVDVAHDLGILGENGRSAIEEYGLLGEIDIVVGAFSKVFASNGGFVAVRDRRLLKYLRVFSSPHLFSNALSPIQAAVLSASFKIVFSPEGDQRRASLLRNVGFLRDGLEAGNIACLGRSSPIVPVVIGSEFEVRVTNYIASEMGVLTNVAEYPVVPRNRARFRLQVQSGHTEREMTSSAASILTSILRAKEYCALV